jgi:hypothetical protein
MGTLLSNAILFISQPFESPFNLDGGCVFKNEPGYGSLFALNFYEKKLIEVRNID